MHTIRLGAGRSPGLGWRDYDIHFRLKKEQNPSMSFASVDQELWLLYMQAPTAHASSSTKGQVNKCYDFNFRGNCQKKFCPYKHSCMHCSRNHPSMKCYSKKSSNNFSSGPSTPQSSGHSTFNKSKPGQPLGRQ